MEISIPTLNFSVIAPEIVVLVTALAVMIVDLFLPREHKSRLAWPSLVLIGLFRLYMLFRVARPGFRS